MNKVLRNDVFLLEGTCLHTQQPFLWVASRLPNRTFPLAAGKWAELFYFQGKNYHRMASVLPSTTRQMCPMENSCAQLCRSFSWVSEPWERVQLPVGTCSSQLANLGTLGNSLFHLPSFVVLPGGNSSCLFADQFMSEREFQAHTRACALSCASGQKFSGFLFHGLWCLLLP